MLSSRWVIKPGAWIGFAAILALGVGIALCQPPPGPPPFELGRLLPPGLRQQLDLTDEQREKIEGLESYAKSKLEDILTPDQRKALESKAGRRRTTVVPKLPDKPGPAVVAGGALEVDGGTDGPKWLISGDASEGGLGIASREGGLRGLRFPSGADSNGDGKKAGGARIAIRGVGKAGRWYSLKVRMLVQDGFKVAREDQPRLKVSFFKDEGNNSLDSISKSLSPVIAADRIHLKDSGTNKNLGRATWRWVGFDFRTPFPEVDTIHVSLEYEGGMGEGPSAEAWVSDMEIMPLPDRTPVAATTARPVPARENLVSIGGRWHYDATGVSREVPARFDHSNADRLVYLTDKPETPFAGNMSAWLRRGFLDRSGNLAERDIHIPDAVTIEVSKGRLLIRSRNLPNHPTGVFPDSSQWLDGNPNMIREQDHTWHIPLDPAPNPTRIAMDATNSNRALPMGPIGVATNGVVFFNPFDHIANADAVWRLDRCCGHPGPGQEYHYHKYPACLNTPWLDDGAGHSPLIGFAFDGFPVYGPYEAAGALAKDCATNPLNAFNLHDDPARGPHYHVTPGRYPHIIGGYWGKVEPQRRGGR